MGQLSNLIVCRNYKTNYRRAKGGLNAGAIHGFKKAVRFNKRRN